MVASAFLVLFQAQTTPFVGTYRLYASAMAGGVYGAAPAGTLVLKADSTYTADGRTGRYALRGGSVRFLSGAFAGGTATFARRAGKTRIDVVTSFPGHPGRKLKLFGNRA